MASLPAEHVEDSLLLRPDALIDLWEITFFGGDKVHFSNVPSFTWQGQFYDRLGSRLSTDGKYADEQSPRPTWVIANPGDLLAPFVAVGVVEGACVVRKRVLRAHIDLDANIFERRVWVVARVAELGNQSISLELRYPSEGPNFMIPAGVYMPPEFPAVSLR